MLVRIHKDWTFPNILRQTPKGKGFWNNIQFTTDEVNNCDLLLVLNRPAENILIKCFPGNIWLMSQESPIDFYTWHTKSFKYFSKVFSFWDKSYSPNIIHTQTSLPWHIDKNFDELLILSENKNNIKQNKTSWVTSNAASKQGHRLRIQFKNYLEKSNFSFDLFGRGFRPIEDKFDGIYPYKYSIAIENYSCNDYWTEKIADCFLSWTMPIYYGCTNITEYFPKESMILIDPTKPEEAIKKIHTAINNNSWEENLPYIRKARELILNEYQLFPSVEKKIQEFANVSKKKCWYYIPANTPYKHNKLSSILENKKLTSKKIFNNITNR
ncbi:MAG: hypothetical protein K9L30_13420 [Desulfobacterales bacterium]|nr:hypothetical protein [Desulfobacterales bacterium]